MSGETEQDVSGWTVDTLKAFLVELIAANRRELDARITANEKLYGAMRTGDKEAVDKAFDAAEALAKQHNDLLRKNERLIDTFATREGVDSAIDQITESRLEQRKSEREAIDARFGRLEHWQGRMTGGIMVVAAVGLANFVRVWTG